MFGAGAVLVVLAAALFLELRASAGNPSTALSLEPGSPQRAAVTEFKALNNPSTAVPLPESVAATAGRLTPSPEVPLSLRPGALQVAQSHELMADVGLLHETFYALPTDKGAVCYFSTSGGGGCVTSFESQPGRVAAFTYVPGELGKSPAEVGGIAPDDVAKVDVLDNGESTPAVLQNNFFFLQLDDPALWPQALSVTYQDGSSRVVSLAPTPPRPS